MIKARRWYEDALARLEDTPEYQTERILLEINEQLVTTLEEEGISRAQFARMLNVQPAYVSKLLNGNPNLTIKTLVRLADSLGLRAHVSLGRKHVIDFREEVNRLETSAMPVSLPVDEDASTLAA